MIIKRADQQSGIDRPHLFTQLQQRAFENQQRRTHEGRRRPAQIVNQETHEMAAGGRTVGCILPDECVRIDDAAFLARRVLGLDLFGLGNIIQFLVGMGQHTTQSISPALRAQITSDDCSIMFPNRIVNLQKLFPYIPLELTNVLRRFSLAAEVYYDTAGELIDDLCRARQALGRSGV